MSQNEPGSINEYLSSLGGAIDSSGGFTIDIKTAQRKLEAHSLPAPELFVVELLALAVSRKATRFSASSEDGWCIFTFDGEALEAGDIMTPEAGVLRKDATASQLHFSLAFSGATALSATGVRYRGAQVCGKYVDGSWTLQEGQSDLEHQVFEVKSPFSFLQKHLNRRGSLNQLLGICSLAPLLIWIEGELLKGGVTSKTLWGDRHSGTLTIAGGEWKTRRKLFDSGFFHDTESHLDYMAELHFGSATAAREEGLFLVRNGVSYEGEVLDLGPSVCGQIYCNHFQRNLSGTSIVRGRFYTEVIDDIQVKIKEYLSLLICSPLRLRSNSLHLKAVVKETLENNEVVADWFADIEAMEDPKTTLVDRYQELNRLKDVGDSEAAREVATVMLEDRLRRLKGWSYGRERTFDEGSGWDWLDFVEPDNYRWKQAREFYEICLHLVGKDSSYQEPLSPLTQSLLHRVKGQTAEAISSLQKAPGGSGFATAKRHLAECYLAQEKFELARKQALENLGWNQVPTPIKPSYEQSSADFYVLADALDLSGLQGESLSVRLAILDHEYDDYTHYLRKDHLADSQGRQLGFGVWVRLRAVAAQNWIRLATSLRLYGIPRSLRRALRGKVDKSSYAGLRKFFNDTGDTYDLAFDFLSSRVAHNLRRQGKFQEADRFLATAHMLVRGKRLATALIEGVEGRENFNSFGR